MVNHSLGNTILSVSDVSLSYGDKQILKNISFDVKDIIRPDVTQGQVISICGRSGVGKSSLFKVLSGFLKPSAGKVLIGDDQHEVKMGEVGVVPQDYPLLNHRTVWENLSIAMGKRTDKKEIINQYSEYFHIDEHLKKYPCDLSGGQRQRVSILQQLLAGNTFILLDEPFSGLDCLMKDKVVELLLKVANLGEHNTLVIVSHDIESSCAIADNVYVMANNTGEGGEFIKHYNLLEMDLAYQSNITKNPSFQHVIEEIKTII